MAEIVSLESRRSKSSPALIMKCVDGDVVECVNVDALSAVERHQFLADKERPVLQQTYRSTALIFTLPSSPDRRP